MLGVALDNGGRNVVMQYAVRQKIAYRILLGDEPTVRQYGGIYALPETLLIDRDGRIASKHVGITSKTDYEREIGKLLGLNVDLHSHRAESRTPTIAQ